MMRSERLPQNHKGLGSSFGVNRYTRMRVGFGYLFVSMLPLVLALGFLSTAFTGGCAKGEPWARAKQVSNRAELIGGPGALGEIGDFLLENDRIRVIIQGPGYSRGFGVYGGALIDADLQRPLAPGGIAGRDGQAQFGELFPVFFLQALVPDRVFVRSDGSDGGPAVVVARGEGGDFLTMTKTLNQVVLNSHEIDGDIFDPRTLDGLPNIEYDIIYELHPGESFIRITSRIKNIAGEDLKIPSPLAQSLLDILFTDLSNFDVPMGALLLFGDGNKVFTPGLGFDMRFSLQDSYKADLSFPAIPGVITPVVATASSNGVSYSFFVDNMEPGESFVANRLTDSGANAYEEAYGISVGNDAMIVPFLSSAFTGVFHGQAPRVLRADEQFEFTAYFAIGQGDVASVLEPMYDVKNIRTGKVQGRVFDELSLAPVDAVSVVILDSDGKPVSQMYTRDGGRFRGKLPPGRYWAIVEKDPVVSKRVPFRVDGGRSSVVDLALPTPSSVSVAVLDESGQRLPARVAVVAEVAPEFRDVETRHWLFDLAIGQRWRSSSMYPEVDGAEIRYIEGEAYTSNGEAVVRVRPGSGYSVYVSRGVEYDLESFDLPPLSPGDLSTHQVTLRRVVDTSGYTATDLHMHASPSLDSDLDLLARVESAAGEGLEFIAATDHNIITDYKAYIYQAGLDRWLTSTEGVELTTLEAGHFNAFPLTRDAGHVVRGSPEWPHRPPDDIFSDLRALGKFGEENTIIMVNHPRDSILGYFHQYNLDPFTATVRESENGSAQMIMSPSGDAFYDDFKRSTFSFDFNTMEVLNGKRLDQLRSFRVPADLSRYNLTREFIDELPEPGTVLCDGEGDVAWPGAIDDWFNFLNLGKRYTIVGNSDSHGDSEGSIGVARTYVWTGQDDPFKVSELDVVRGILDHRAIVTNGPFVELFVDGSPIGSDVTSSTGRVEVLIRIQVPNWVDVSSAVLYANAQPIQTFDVVPENGLFEQRTNLELIEDTWFVVEVEGERQLFPVYPPIEVSPVELNDAFASIAEPFGFATGDLGEILPRRMGLVTPYAITNPIWVDVGGDGFTPPGLSWRECVGYGLEVDYDRKMDKSMRPKSRFVDNELVPSFWFPRVRGDASDIRTYFDNLML